MYYCTVLYGRDVTANLHQYLRVFLLYIPLQKPEELTILWNFFKGDNKVKISVNI